MFRIGPHVSMCSGGARIRTGFFCRSSRKSAAGIPAFESSIFSCSRTWWNLSEVKCDQVASNDIEKNSNILAAIFYEWFAWSSGLRTTAAFHWPRVLEYLRVVASSHNPCNPTGKAKWPTTTTTVQVSCPISMWNTILHHFREFPHLMVVGGVDIADIIDDRHIRVNSPTQRAVLLGIFFCLSLRKTPSPESFIIYLFLKKKCSL